MTDKTPKTIDFDQHEVQHPDKPGPTVNRDLLAAIAMAHARSFRGITAEEARGLADAVIEELEDPE